MKLFLVAVACMLPLIGAAAVPQTQNNATPQTQTKPQSQTTTPAPAAPAPANNGASLVNPVKPTEASQKMAKERYGWDCAMCHGDTGKGNGSLAVSEKLSMQDLSNPSTLQGMSDGQIFTIIRKGAAQMPPEDKARANDNAVWNLVIYLRSLSKGEETPAS